MWGTHEGDVPTPTAAYRGRGDMGWKWGGGGGRGALGQSLWDGGWGGGGHGQSRCLSPRFHVCLLWGEGEGVTPIPHIGDRPRDGVGPLPDPHPPLPPPPPLTRSLHRQHPDSSVCLFVCFKYIYILYI